MPGFLPDVPEIREDMCDYLGEVLMATFTEADVPIIGLVENMAGYECPDCGAVSDPFGNGGAEAAAKELGPGIGG